MTSEAISPSTMAPQAKAMTSQATAATPAAGRWRVRAAVFVTAAIVLLVQVFYTTAGRMYGESSKGEAAWSGYSHYFNALAEGFVDGQLSLRTRPSPELLALPDPWDPAQNTGKKIHDALLFKGADGEYRYYLYWGPVPGLLVAGAKVVGGGDAVVITDQRLVMFFSAMCVLFSSLLLVWVRETLLPETPTGLVCVAVAMTGLLPTHLYFITRPAVYEASIMGGQAFLVAGVFFAVLGAGVRARWWWLLHTGVCWGLATGTRVSLAPAVMILSLLVAARVWSLLGFRAWRAWLPSALALGLPLLAAGIGLMTYNAMRFGSPTDFGVVYQLPGVDIRKLLALGYSSWRYIDVNVTVYLTAPLMIIDQFPYITGNASMPELPLHHYVAPHHSFEPTAGLIWSTPILFFTLVPLVIAALEWRPRRANTNAEKWVTVLVLTGAVAGIFPALTLSGTTMRYLLDALPLLAVAAGIGIWQSVRPFVRAGRTYYTLNSAVTVLAAWTLLVALAFGFTGYSGSFKRDNPELFQKISQFFS